MSFTYETLVVGPIDVNCYILRDEATGEGVIIDPGDNGQEILAYVRDTDLKVKMLINTHGHWDHIGAVDLLRDELQVPLLIHQADGDMLVSGRSNLSSFMGQEAFRRPAEMFIKDGDVISFGKSSLRVIHTPGHTPGGVCLYGNGCLFSGDTLFASSIGRTDFPGGSMEEMLKSVNVGLAKVPDQAKVFPGHGPATTMGRERRCNPYMQGYSLQQLAAMEADGTIS